MKQMSGRGKFFMAPGMSPNGKICKFDDNRFLFLEGGHCRPPYGSAFPSPDFGFASVPRTPFEPSGIL